MWEAGSATHPTHEHAVRYVLVGLGECERERERQGEIPTDHLPRTCSCGRGALPPSHSTRPTRAIVVSQQALADARSDIHAFLIAAWDTLLQHRLPPYSLSPTNLAHFLARRIRLPSNLPLPLTARNMHAYYSLIRAQPVASATQLLFVYLHIPLVEASKAFYGIPCPPTRREPEGAEFTFAVFDLVIDDIIQARPEQQLV